MYITYDHSNSDSCLFSSQVHNSKIIVSVVDAGPHIQHCGHVPALQGAPAIYIGSPKNERLCQIYMGLLKWAGAQEYRLKNWSVEEWLISPVTTNNSDLWMIRVMIPLRGTRIQA